jgi:CDGSH-type Zn-finger protein
MATDDKISVKINKDGPYIVQNCTSLMNSKGEELPTKEYIALCRCGASKNKPFCDGSHKAVEFKDDKN